MTDSDEVKLLPCIPTPEMIAAAWAVIDGEKDATGIAKLGTGLGVREIWQAMWEATRPPVVTDEVVEPEDALTGAINAELLNRVADLEGHWKALERIIEEVYVETDQPDRVRWEGVWYDGPLATAYLRTMKAIQKLARKALASMPAVVSGGQGERP